MTEALVIGKFYPPHLGHVGLVEHAAKQSDWVTVLVMASAAEAIPLADRIAWLTEAVHHVPGVRVTGIPCDAPVDYASDIAWVAHIAHMRAALDALGVCRVDLVAGSENYVGTLAARLGARALVYDIERRAAPVSGSAVRADLVGSWQLLPAPVRRGLAVRVVVLGAESTGTTTLAGALVAHYRSRGFPSITTVPEFGREFTYLLHAQQAEEAERCGASVPLADEIVWRPEHFETIASRQMHLENAAALACPLVVADTDALATTVWERRYVADTSCASAGALACLPRRDLYLVTDHVGVDFEQDGWRDGEHLRPWMTQEFVRILHAAGHSWILLRGDEQERLDFAVAAIDPILARRLHLAAPLPQAGVVT